MLVVGLIGIIATAALAPLVFTVRSLEEAQQRWGTSHNTAAAAETIYWAVGRGVPTPCFSTFNIFHIGGLSP